MRAGLPAQRGRQPFGGARRGRPRPPRRSHAAARRDGRVRADGGSRLGLLRRCGSRPWDSGSSSSHHGRVLVHQRVLRVARRAAGLRRLGRLGQSRLGIRRRSRRLPPPRSPTRTSTMSGTGREGPIPIRRHPPKEMNRAQAAFLDGAVASGHRYVEDHNRPGAVGAGPTPRNVRDGMRMSTAVTYLAQARSRANLTIRPDTVVATRRVLGNARHRGPPPRRIPHRSRPGGARRGNLRQPHDPCPLGHRPGRGTPSTRHRPGRGSARASDRISPTTRWSPSTFRLDRLRAQVASRLT